DLELMSEGELETHLAGQQIIELLEHQFLHPLAQLDERLEALAASIGIEGNPRNPLRPEVAVSAFVELFEADDLTPGLRTMVFQQFDKRLPKILGEVYAKSNATLAEAEYGGQRAGYRPRPARPGDRRPARTAEERGQWVPDGGLVERLGAAGSDGPSAGATFSGHAAGAGASGGAPAPGPAPARD